MTQAIDIITRASVLAGVSALGETLSGEEQQYALETLNDMLDSWNTDGIYLYAVETLIATVSALPFSVGPSGDVNTPKSPVKFLPGSFFRSGNYDYGFEWIDQEEYDKIQYKTVATLWPEVAYYKATEPLAYVYVYPKLSAPAEVHLQAQIQLTEFADLTTEYDFPKGYRKALVSSLAELLCIGLKPIDPALQNQAMKDRMKIQQTNLVVPQLDMGTVRPFSVLIGR